MAPALSHTQYDLVGKSSTLDALIGYFTPSHVIHQRLLFVFKCSWGWTRKASETCTVIIAVPNKHTAKLHHIGSLYVLTYDTRKLNG